jgi:hypothetical protein
MLPLHQVAWNFYVHVIAAQEGGLVSMIMVPLSVSVNIATTTKIALTLYQGAG